MISSKKFFQRVWHRDIIIIDYYMLSVSSNDRGQPIGTHPAIFVPHGVAKALEYIPHKEFGKEVLGKYCGIRISTICTKTYPLVVFRLDPYRGPKVPKVIKGNRHLKNDLSSILICSNESAMSKVSVYKYHFF